jgi:hypothetical protein
MWPRFTFQGCCGGNVIVVSFDLSGIVTACMAVSSSPSGTNPVSESRNLVEERKERLNADRAVVMSQATRRSLEIA